MSETAEHRGLPEEERNLIQAQYEASGTIYGSNNVAEILEALLSITGSIYSFGHLALVEPDSEMLRIVAEADPEGVRLTEQFRPLSDYPAYETLTAVEVLNIQNVSADTFLMDAERARLVEQNVGALLITPLVIGQRLIGVLMFWNATPVTVSAARLRTLRSLADQAAVVFENQALLRNTEATLEEVRTLYDINRAMLGAQHMLDIMRLLRGYLASNSSSILHISYEDRPDIGWHPVLRYRLAANGEGLINTTLEVEGALEAVESANVLFVEDTAAETHNPFNPFLREQGAVSYVLIYMAEQRRVEEIIAITFDTAQTFDQRTHRLYEAIADQIQIVLENQRLLRDTQANTVQLSRQVRVLQAVNRLATGAGSFNNSEKALLDFTIHEMTTSLDADHGGLMMFDPELIYGTVMAEYPSHGTEGVRLEMRGNALFEAMRQDPTRPFIVYNVEHDHRVTPDTLQVFRSAGIQSLMMVPIMLDNKLIASIGLDLYTRERQFSPEMIELAQTMGAQFAIGLQNARLLREAQRRADQLQRIAIFGQSVQATLDLPALLNIMLNETRQMLSLDRITIALYDPQRHELRSVAEHEDGRSKVHVENGVVLPLSGTLVGEMWQSQKPIYIGDVDEVPEERRAEAVGMRSVLLLPLRLRGQLRGLVQIGSRQVYSYSETDSALLQQLIGQFAVALENSEAYAQSQRAARNQALVNEIAAKYQEVSTVDELLQVTLEGLSKSLGAQRGGIRLGNVQEVNP
jgi:GAF domain-containing protein